MYVASWRISVECTDYLAIFHEGYAIFYPLVLDRKNNSLLKMGKLVVSNFTLLLNKKNK